MNFRYAVIGVLISVFWSLAGESSAQDSFLPSKIGPEPLFVPTETITQDTCASANADAIQLIQRFAISIGTAEAIILDGICRGETEFDLSFYDIKELPCSPDDIPGDIPMTRLVDAEFLALILSKKAFHDMFARPRFRLECAFLFNEFDLSYAHVPLSVGIWDSQFIERIYLLEAKFDRFLGFNGSTFDDRFVAERIQVNSNLSLRRGVKAARDVDLDSAVIQGRLSLSGSNFLEGIHLRDAKIGIDVWAEKTFVDGSILADGAKIGGSFSFWNKGRINGDLFLHGSKIGQSLSMRSLTLEGELGADRSQIGENVTAIDADFQNEVDLDSVTVGGLVELRDSKFGSHLRMSTSSIGRSVLITSSEIVGDVMIRESRIALRIRVVESRFRGDLVAQRIHTGSTVALRANSTFHKRVSFVGARVGGTLVLEGSDFLGPVAADGIEVNGPVFVRDGSVFLRDVDFVASKIANDLQIGGSTFNGHLHLAGAQIQNELLVSSPGAGHGRPTWGPQARLTLRNVGVRTLQAEMEAWQRNDGTWVATDLTGFRYDQLGGLNAEREGGVNMADAPVADLVAWITKSQQLDTSRYDPQPFEQLAAALEASGADKVADEVRYEKFEHKRTFAGTPLMEKAQLFASRIFLGHGVGPRPVIALLSWFLVLMVLSFSAVTYSKARELQTANARLWFAVDNALPLLELYPRDRPVDHGNIWVVSALHTFKIAGFVLATVLVAVIAGFGG